MPNSIEGASPIFIPTLPLLEHWKPIPTWEGYYQVSNMGRIWSDRSGKERRSFPNKKGYLMVQLSRDGKPKGYQVHGFVAEQFVGARPKGLLVNHISGWKRKNWSSNLEYLTSLENTRHAMRIGTYKPGTYQQKLDDEDIANIRELLELGLYTVEIASLYRVDASAISRIKNGKFKTRPKEAIVGYEMKGEQHPMSKMTEDGVRVIRAMKGIMKLRELAEMFGTSITNVGDIQRGKTWKHVT